MLKLNSSMKVSICIPIYGVEKYISRCAESLFNQTYNDIEYIFVNDCTLDNSIVILENVISDYPSHNDSIRIVNHTKNRGLAAARLTGLQNATGDSIMFVDSDDYLESNSVELLVKEMLRSDSDIVSGAFNHIFSTGKKLFELPYMGSDVHSLLKLILERRIALNVWGRLYKRELFDNSDATFIEGINMGEDYVVTSRLFYYAKRISSISIPIYNYLHINESSYTTVFKIKNYENILSAEKVIMSFYQNKSEEDLIYYHKIGNLKLKSEQLISFLRSSISDKLLYKEILNLFSDYKDYDQIQSCISLQDRLILKLSVYLPMFLMRIVVKFGYFIKQLYK